MVFDNTQETDDRSAFLQKLAARVNLGVIVGLFCVITMTYLMWSMGVCVSKFHWLLFPAGYLVAGYKLPVPQLKWYLAILIFILFVIWLWSVVCGNLYGLNWDGMLGHKEYVMALKGGWNPVADPMYELERVGNSEWARKASFWKIWWGGFNVRFGYIFQAILAQAVGSVESAKATNLLFFILPLSAGIYASLRWSMGLSVSIFIGVVLALNPVWILQSVSFWEDAQFAGLSVAALLFAILVGKRGELLDYICLAGLLILMTGAKRSGLAFSAVLVCMTILMKCMQNLITKKTLMLVGIGGLAIVIIFGIGVGIGIWRTHGVFPYDLEQILSANKLERIFDDQLLDRVPTLDGLWGPLQFFATVLSEGRMVPSDVSLKAPFVMTGQEVDLYTHIFTAPWFGGFGPWFGQILVVLVVLNVVVFFKHVGVGTIKEKMEFWPWFLFLLLLMAIMPPFFPRWIPFMWALPVLMIVSIILSGKNDSARRPVGALSGSMRAPFSLSSLEGIGRHVSLIGLGLLCVNSVILLSLNLYGHRRASNVVHEQLDFIEAYLSQPIEVCFIDFASNREWLNTRGIQWKPNDYGWKNPNFMVLGRTNTYVKLEGIDPNAEIRLGSQKWDSLNDWKLSINERLGFRRNWEAWIRNSIIIKRPELLEANQTTP